MNFSRSQMDKNFKRFFQDSLNGIAIQEMVFDEEGRPADYRFIEVNRAFTTITGLERDAIIGKTALEVFPRLEKSRIETYGEVVLTGEPAIFENYDRDLEKYFAVSAFKLEGNRFAIIVNDITDQVSACERLAKDEVFLGTVFDAVQDGLSVLDTDLNIVKVSPSLKKRYGQFAPLSGKKCYQVFQQRSSPCPQCPSIKTIKTGETQTAEVPFPSAEAPQAWFGLVTCPMKDDYGKVTGVVELVKDITEQKAAADIIRKQNTFLKNIIDSLPYPFYVINIEDYSIAIANREACPHPSWEGLTCYAFFHHRETPCEGKDRLCPVAEVKRKGRPVIIEHAHFDAEGGKRTVEVHGYPILDDQGKVVQLIEYSVDITPRKMLEERLHQMSITDELTGLLNRRGFMTLAAERLKLAARQKYSDQLLLYADFDDMKCINDRFGHEMGDRALREAAAALRGTFRASDICGRLGGDEFVVMLTVDAENKHNIEAITRRLENTIARANQRENRPYNLSLSIGIARYDSQTTATLDALISQADRLMYEGKSQRKNPCT